LLKNSFSDSLLPVTSFPDSAPVAGFPPVAEDRSVAELGIFQQTVKPDTFQRFTVCLKAYPDTNREFFPQTAKAYPDTKSRVRQQPEASSLR
ncbi:MAG TPA: hypothetical protein VN948_16360, partial [Terriglobales bacterium]|nr:hypothetical protein [Terriglobales bacterium]